MSLLAATSSPARRLAHASLAFVASNVARAVLGFALSLAIGRGLGAVNFGRWTFCMAWASGLTMISDLGLSVLVTRDAARSRSEARQLLVAAVVAKLLLLAPLGAVVYFFARVLAIDAESIAALRVGVLLAAAGVTYGCFAAVFRAFEWIVSLFWIETTGLVLQLLGSIWILSAGGSVLHLIVLATGVQLAQLALAAAIWRPTSPGSTLARSWQPVIPMIRRSVPFALAGVLANLQTRWSPIALGYLSGQAEVGWFGAAWRLGEVAKLVPHGVFGAALPVFSAEADSRDRHESLLPAFERALLVLAVGIAVVLIVFAGPILQLTFGADFRPAVWTLVWVGAGVIPTLMNSGRKVYLYAAGRESRALGLTAVALGIQLAISLPLILIFGASGAALSILLGEAAVWRPLRRRP